MCVRFCRRFNTGGMYSKFKKDGDESARSGAEADDRAELEAYGRESRASVDKSLERVRVSLQRQFDERKLDMMEVSHVMPRDVTREQTTDCTLCVVCFFFRKRRIEFRS